MKRPIAVAAAALSLALCAALAVVLVRATRSGIAIRLGSGAPVLAPPPPTASALPAPQASGYTNEDLHSMLQKETSEIGIQGIVTRGERDERGEEAPEGFLGPRLGEPGTRAQAEAAIRQLTRLRRGVESGKKPTIPLAGMTVPLLTEPARGGKSLEAEPAPAPAPDAPPPPARTAQDGAWSGLYGGTQVGTLTLSDAQTWAQLWAGLSRDPLPPVDFTRQQVVGVFLGHRPTGGFRVEIDPAVTVLAAGVVVRYREVAPAPGHTAPEGPTAPYALRTIARTSLPVRFEKAP